MTNRVIRYTARALNTPTLSATRVTTALLRYCAQALMKAAINVQNRLEAIVSGATTVEGMPIAW